MRKCPNYKPLHDVADKYRGQLILLEFDVYELRGIQDAKDDYYWVINTGRGLKYSSCVGSFIPLKDYLPKEIYKRLKNCWDMNDALKWIEDNSFWEIGIGLA